MFNYVKIEGKDEITYHKNTSYDKTYEKLPAGVYQLIGHRTLFGTFFTFNPSKTPDNLIQFKEGIVSEIVQGANKFLSKEVQEKYKQLGIGHKMGIILYGPPGTGKTSTGFLVLDTLAREQNAISLICTTLHLNDIMENIRRIREVQDNPIVIFVDEVDQAMRDHESAYLTFLDGEESFNNIMFLGCTNYLHKISDRIKKRPSRIKACHEINKFPDKVYREYIKTKITDIQDKDLDEMVFKVSEAGLTIDQVKHMLIDWYINEINVDRCIEGVKAMEKIK